MTNHFGDASREIKYKQQKEARSKIYFTALATTV
jgi:hypothetical protein